MSNVEIEATLAICSAKPALVADEIADLTTIGPYRLRPRPELAICDVYLDRADHALRTHGFSIRVRNVDGSQMITLKGRPKKVVGGGRRREEIEMVWSEDALNSIMVRVADGGLRLMPPSDVFEWHDPLAVLSGMGFLAEQTRNTRRRPRDVTGSEDSATVLAELVVDAVSYQFSLGNVRHHEVEIEVKADDGLTAMHVITNGLLSRWPTTLRVWDHGKRSTGDAVEALMADQGTGGLIANTGDLVPEAYDLLASRLH